MWRGDSYQESNIAKCSPSWVKCGGGESSVLAVGRDAVSGAGPELIIVIPGNPGTGRMYQTFLLALHGAVAGPDREVAVWALSYLGHHTRQPSILPAGGRGPAVV